MPRVLLIRPLEDALPLAKVLESKGVEPLLYPLFEPRFFPLPPLKTPQAFIITSKNALRAIEGYEELKKIPLYVVGDQTAGLAQAKGFSKVLSASGTSQELTELILDHAHRDKGILWHLTGEVMKGNIVSTLRTNGFKAERHIVYYIQTAENLPEPLLIDLQKENISHVMFFSPRTTTIFINLILKNVLEKKASQMIALCLSHDVAEEVGCLKWKKIWISSQPATENMIGYFDEE
jgi:uroporphyrinogen-III synthase